MDRRHFIKNAACAAGALGATGLVGCKGEGGTAGAPRPVAGVPRTTSGADPTTTGAAVKAGSNRVFEAPPGDVHAAVASNGEPAELVKAAVDAFGGPDAIVHSGDVVVIKPNLAWSQEPEVGANTDPEVLRAVIGMARDAGASEVLVMENSCDPSTVSFELSGGQQVCEDMGVHLISLENRGMFQEMPMSNGVHLKSELLPRDILDCDVYINLPCLKHHSATNMTLAIKNQLGAVFNPQRYHKTGARGAGGLNLHQNIADLATILRPTINIGDATRTLTNNGPKGPGVVEETRTIIVSHDIVTVDALGAELLGAYVDGVTVDAVPYIGLAAKAGLGRLDLDALNIARV